MDLQKIILDSINQKTIESISNKTQTDQSSVENIIKVGLPIIIGALAKNASDKKGSSQLSEALESKHDGSLLDSIGVLFGGEKSASDDGLKILGHIFGSKTEATEDKLAKKLNIDANTVAKVLSFVAPIVLAAIGKEKIKSSLNADGLTDLLTKQKSNDGNPIMDIATQFIDKNKDGQIFDDLISLFTKGRK